jgi:hypothetical protein
VVLLKKRPDLLLLFWSQLQIFGKANKLRSIDCGVWIC